MLKYCVNAIAFVVKLMAYIAALFIFIAAGLAGAKSVLYFFLFFMGFRVVYDLYFGRNYLDEAPAEPLLQNIYKASIAWPINGVEMKGTQSHD